MMNLGQKIKQLRGEESISNFCRRAGIDRTVYYKLESNRQNPTIGTLEKIAEATNHKLIIDFQPKEKS